MSIQLIRRHILILIAMNRSVKLVAGIDFPFTPELTVQKTDSHMIFTMGEPSTDPVAGSHW